MEQLKIKINVAKFPCCLRFTTPYFQVYNHGSHKEIAFVVRIRSQGNLFASPGHVCLLCSLFLYFFHRIKCQINNYKSRFLKALIKLLKKCPF